MHGGCHDHYNISIDDPSLPKTCDVKEALTDKLKQLDTKIYQLMKSNKIIEEDLVNDPDLPHYVKENNEIIENTKEEIMRILNAFLKSGMNLDKEVYPQLKYKSLYLGGEFDADKNES
jgi:hypothetical protein